MRVTNNHRGPLVIESLAAPGRLFTPLFPELEVSIEGTNLQSIGGVQKKTAELRKVLSQNYFRRCFESQKALMETGAYPEVFVGKGGRGRP